MENKGPVDKLLSKSSYKKLFCPPHLMTSVLRELCQTISNFLKTNNRDIHTDFMLRLPSCVERKKPGLNLSLKLSFFIRYTATSLIQLLSSRRDCLKTYAVIPIFKRYCSRLLMKQAGVIQYVFDTNQMEWQHPVQE